jgi:hypothetical protein
MEHAGCGSLVTRNLSVVYHRFRWGKSLATCRSSIDPGEVRMLADYNGTVGGACAQGEDVVAVNKATSP